MPGGWRVGTCPSYRRRGGNRPEFRGPGRLVWQDFALSAPFGAGPMRSGIA